MGLLRRRHSSHRNSSRDATLSASSRNNVRTKTDKPTTILSSTVSSSFLPPQPSLDCLPQLVADLAKATTKASKPCHAKSRAMILRRLYSLSEHESFQDNRNYMAQHTVLVPILLQVVMLWHPRQRTIDGTSIGTTHCHARSICGDDDDDDSHDTMAPKSHCNQTKCRRLTRRRTKPLRNKNNKCSNTDEQLLALLVLNNLCIPYGNKRLLLQQHQVAHVLLDLLRINDDDRLKCHWMVIVLVNLSVGNAALRREWIQPRVMRLKHDDGARENANHDQDATTLLEALVQVLRMAVSVAEQLPEQTKKELGTERRQMPDATLLKVPGTLQQNCSLQSHASTSVQQLSKQNCGYKENCELHCTRLSCTLLGWPPSPPTANQAAPETARWIMVALQNLSRPCHDQCIGQAFVSIPGLVPLLMSLLVRECNNDSHQQSQLECQEPRFKSFRAIHVAKESVENRRPTTEMTKEPLMPTRLLECYEPLVSWDSHSSQSAALMVLVNLAAMPAVREFLLYQVPTVNVLSAIIQQHGPHSGATERVGESEVVVFQRIKAKMGMAYLLCSSGQFGQVPAAPEVAAVLEEYRTLIQLSEVEAIKLVSILTNTIHGRPDPGPSGYAAHSFSVKYILLAVRCLLTQYENQALCARTVGMELNALLAKVLALYVFGKAAWMDAEAAEYASFSLYLQSNFCFANSKAHIPFLPLSWANPEATGAFQPNMCSICDLRLVKILTAYLQQPAITPAGKHSAEQLLKRMRYLHFVDERCCLNQFTSEVASDFELEAELCELLDMMTVKEIVVPGVCPSASIMDRPLLRRCALGECSSEGAWDHGVNWFPSALLAAQDFSYGSSKVRHLEAIDDVLIANNIILVASGEKSESYNCLWSWEEKADEIQRRLSGQLMSELDHVSCHVVQSVALLPSLGILDKLLFSLNP